MWGDTLSAEAYSAVTGKTVSPITHFRYDVVCQFDPARNADDAYTKQYYFDKEGDLKWNLIFYEKDKIEIKVDLGITETIDVTEWYFSGEDGRAPQLIEDGIKENISHTK